MKAVIAFFYFVYVALCFYAATVVATLDFQEPGEAAIQGWNEWGPFVYVAFIGVILSFSLWSTYQNNNKILISGFWVALLILVFHLAYVAIMGEGMGIVIMSTLQLPLLLGVLFFKKYMNDLKLPSNKVIQPGQPPSSASG
jgi:hypothetical protein